MKKVLLANSGAERCGVYQFGMNFYTVWTHKPQPTYALTHQGFNNVNDFLSFAQPFDAVIVNWHTAATSWMTDEALKSLREQGKKVLLIPHDEIVQFGNVDATLFIDPTIDEATLPKAQYVLGRPILPVYLPNCPINTVCPNIGFAGFAFDHKHIERILDLIKAEGPDFKCKVRLHLPPSDYGYNPSYVDQIATQFQQQVETTVCREFLSAEDLVRFMAANDVNIFPYEDKRVVNRGISSITDIALAAGKPFMISESNMFRHFAPEHREMMTIGKVSIKDVLTKGGVPYRSYAFKWSAKHNMAQLEKIIKEVCV